ncbi:MAG: radical SAM protein [Candidatus Cloacimonetes bacterium]|nr:radical SAM protein [Candidatus Cloacimonadota bacterium]
MQTLNLLKNSCKAVASFSKNRPINSVTEIKITRLCNQRCRQCNIYEKQTEPKHLTYTNFRRVARRLQKYGSFVGFISGGEPILNPELPEILLYSRKIFPLSVSLVSGLYFDYKKISKIVNLCLDEDINIQTSLDGLDELGNYLRGVKNHSDTILNNMEKIATKKEQMGSKSFLYANCVLSAINLSQIPEIINACKNAGWKVTIGLYHSLIETTKVDGEMIIKDEGKFLKTVEFLKDNPDILNLNTFIEGLPRILNNDFPDLCPFVDGKKSSTRLTIMENADLHLCFGEEIGNLLEDDLQSIFESEFYKQRLAQYRECKGCWSSCYTQKYLLFHPKNPQQAIHNFRKLLNLEVAAK